MGNNLLFKINILFYGFEQKLFLWNYFFRSKLIVFNISIHFQVLPTRIQDRYDRCSKGHLNVLHPSDTRRRELHLNLKIGLTQFSQLVYITLGPRSSGVYDTFDGQTPNERTWNCHYSHLKYFLKYYRGLKFETFFFCNVLYVLRTLITKLFCSQECALRFQIFFTPWVCLGNEIIF